MLTGRDVADFTPSNTGENNTGQQNTSQGNQQSQEAKPTQAPTVSVSNGEGLKIDAQLVDDWESESGKSCNYNLTITNENSRDVTGWKIELTFSAPIKEVQGWSGNFSISGNSLLISNVDYNARIAAGESVKDIGFIVTGGSDIKIVN